ncbi:hypothetical protein HYW82_02220 [Candidatus Peregrinibacteria bacterium]|nr:hypothetical protein [Candidatus Peregrinibacteria bacterium]
MAKERNDNQDGVHEDEVSVDGRAQVVDVADVPVMKGFADAVNAAVSRSVLSDCFSKFLGGENRDGFLYREVFEKNNSAMQQAFLLLNDLVVRFGFEKSILFKNEAIGKDLNKRFEEFVRRFDGDLDKVEEVIRGSEDCSNFSANWRENLKVAAYYVFLIHYGAKRKGEKDAKGDSQDYAYHPVASAVGNVVQKCRFFCEQTVIAAMLHDVLEDWPVGIAGLLNSSVEDLNPKFFGKDGPVWVPKAHAESLRERHGASFDKHFSWVCSSLGGVSGQPGNVSGAAVFFSRMVSIEALVKLVTKSGDNKARQIVEMFYGVLGHKRAQRFSAMRAIIIKISDRLDNTRTFIQKIRAGMSGGAEVSEEKFQEVAADTIYTFMACAVAMRMWNVADWLYDYLIFRDPDERERRIVLRSKRDRRDMGPVVLKDGQHWPGLKREFSAEFQDEMKREMMDSTMTEGVDYILNYRPVGFRYEDGEIAEDMARDGRYEQALQNFVIFRCVRNDPNMCFAAAEVFKRLFPKPLKHQWAGRGEFNSVLGRRLGENRMGVSTDEHSFFIRTQRQWNAERECPSFLAIWKGLLPIYMIHIKFWITIGGDWIQMLCGRRCWTELPELPARLILPLKILVYRGQMSWKGCWINW